jgi:arylsulfatase A-like enzyme
MPRPPLLTYARALFLPWCLLGWVGPARAESLSEKPNILFILTDDQGYGDLGCHGNPTLKTPNLDALHAESVRFTDFCVNTSCSPTRASLMSGLYHLRVGVTHTVDPRCRMATEISILPQYLKAAGYATACIGKWHLGEQGPYAPAQRGFDEVAGKAAHYQEGRYREDLLFDEAISFMSRHQTEPFFCYLATWSPHAPLVVPESYAAPYRDAVDADKAQFFGMVANIDENVGRILRWLEEKDLRRKTMVVFMNDNGGTHGVDSWNSGMRGCKCTVWPGGTRAISFWSWPGHWSPRAVSDLTAHVDVLPTLAASAGVELPSSNQGLSFDGYDLTPLLEGGEVPALAERLVFQHNARWPGALAAEHKESMAAVRYREYLLVRSRPCSDPDGRCSAGKLSQCDQLRRVEQGVDVGTYTKNAQFIWGLTPGNGWALYDVHRDPACRENLRDQRPELAGRLLDAYHRWWDAIYPEMLAAGGDAPLSPTAIQSALSRGGK